MHQADAEMVFVLRTAFGALGAMGVELRASSSVFRTSQIGPEAVLRPSPRKAVTQRQFVAIPKPRQSLRETAARVISCRGTLFRPIGSRSEQRATARRLIRLPIIDAVMRVDSGQRAVMDQCVQRGVDRVEQCIIAAAQADGEVPAQLGLKVGGVDV